VVRSPSGTSLDGPEGILKWPSSGWQAPPATRRKPQFKELSRGSYFVDFPFLVAAAFVLAFEVSAADLAEVLPSLSTVTAPGPGMKLDSSPVDHRTLKMDPVAPVTTPSRGG